MASLTSKQYRFTNLSSVAREWQAAGRRLVDLAAELGISDSYLSQLLNKKRAIGDRTARSIEARLGWDVGAMDSIHPAYLSPAESPSPAPPADGAPASSHLSADALRLAQFYEEASPAQREMFDALARSYRSTKNRD